MTSPEEVARGLSEAQRRDLLGLRMGTVAAAHCAEFVKLGIAEWQSHLRIKLTPLGLAVRQLLTGGDG